MVSPDCPVPFARSVWFLEMDVNESVEYFYQSNGFCPICEKDVVFSSKNHDFRPQLRCPSCVNGSVPRERALALVLKRLVPDWRDRSIHESSPVGRGITMQLRRERPNYIGTQYFPGQEPGKSIRGFRNENLERQTFGDELFDVAMSLDVLEHVNDPEKALSESARTIKPGGYCIFTAPTVAGKLKTERRARIHEDGVEEIISGEAEYHGNPVNEKGALVTFHYGYDFPDLIFEWSKMPVEVLRFHDPYHGIIGPMTEVYVCHKRA